MEKILIVVYLDSRGLDRDQQQEWLKSTYKVCNDMEKDQPNLLHYIIMSDQPSKIECINPKLISEDEFKKVQEILDLCKSKLQEIKK